MKVLLLNQFFWPDSAATSQLLTEFARYLAAEGHQVSVICGPNGYAVTEPEGVRPPVEILRTPGWRFSRGILGRVLSYASFALSSLCRGFFVSKPDLIVTLTTPPLLSLVGALLSKVRGARHFIWEMDLYPEVATDLGYLKPESMAARLVGFLADTARLHSDGVVVLGDCMRNRMIARGIPASKVHVAENWADGNLVRPLPPRDDGRVRILYSGNLGLAHEVDTIAGAIAQLRDDERLRFVFIGDGARRKAFEEWCGKEQFSTVEFLPYQRRERLSESLGYGDIGLVTLLPACTGAVVPSKTYALMAAARPILFIGDSNAMTARTIERFQCGWRIEPGDVQALTALLQTIANNPAIARKAGERARQAFLEHFNMPASVSRLSRTLGIASNLITI